jgi:ribosome biogenesis protein UTP30
MPRNPLGRRKKVIRRKLSEQTILGYKNRAKKRIAKQKKILQEEERKRNEVEKKKKVIEDNVLYRRVSDGSVQLEKAQIVSGVQALKDFVEMRSMNQTDNSMKKDIFEGEGEVLLCISLLSAPIVSKTGIPTAVPVPYSLYPDDCDICLFVPNGFKKKHKKEDLPHVKKIIEIDALRRKYHQFEAKRKLLGSYDLFLCSRRIKFTLRAILGSVFIRPKRYPIPINIKTIPDSIVKAKNSVACYTPKGTCALVRIGRLSQPPEEIAANIMRGINPIVHSYKKRWVDIQSLQIRTADSISIPIYYAKEYV